jgi:hypothetical protein
MAPSFLLRVQDFRSNVAAHFFSLAYDAQSCDKLIKTCTDKAVASSSRVGRAVSSALARRYVRDSPVTKRHVPDERNSEFYSRLYSRMFTLSFVRTCWVFRTKPCARVHTFFV